MPYPNEHAARLKDPKQYIRIRRENDKFGDGIHAIWGILVKDGKETAEVQAIRFDVKKFTVKEAKKWLKEHDHKPILFEPATTEGENSFVLPFVSQDAEFICSGNSEETPSKLYRKELIHVGEYVKEVDNTHFAVTLSILEHWVNIFHLFLANGIKVPVPSSHFGDNNGYVRELSVEGESLYGVLELFGEDADKLAKTNDVSIYAPVEWVDGTGHIYSYPILHVALTPYPVIPGLQEFEAIAASFLARKETNKMDWSKIKEALGIEPDVTDENAEGLILSAISTVSDRVTELEEVKKTLEEGKTTLEAENKTLRLSNEPKEPEPILLKLATENVDNKLSGLVAAGRITPAVRDKLRMLFIGADSGALKLSLTRGQTDICDGVVIALGENDPVLLAEQTGQQDLQLSDPAQKVSESPVVKDAEQRAEAAKANA